MQRDAGELTQSKIPRKSRRPRKAPMSRINLTMPTRLYEDLINFEHDIGRASLGETIRWCFGAAKFIWDELSQGNRIFVVTPEGEKKEIHIPW